MIPFGHESVTLVQRVETKDNNGRTKVTFAKHALTGCSWQRTEGRKLSGNEVRRNESILCRIPAEQQRPRAGDTLFLGDMVEEVADAMALQAAIEAHRDAGVFIVTAVKDNARPGSPLPHWAASGE